MAAAATADAALQKTVLKIFAKGMKAEHTPDVQAAASIALCKLMLTSVIRDEDLLKQMVVCYFDPVTKDNAGVRQALNYFLPVYCHSRRENMETMAGAAGGVMHLLVDMSEEIEGEEMIGINTVGTMLVDWTDARKLVVKNETTITWDEAGRKEVEAVNGDIHLGLAESLLLRAIHHGCTSKGAQLLLAPMVLTGNTEEERKAIIAMLGKLYISANSKTEKLQSTIELVVEAINGKIAQDAPARNALKKLHSALSKALGDSEKVKPVSADTLVPTGRDDGPTTVEGKVIEGSTMANEEDVEMDGDGDEGVTEVQDSLLEKLPEGEDDDL